MNKDCYYYYYNYYYIKEQLKFATFLGVEEGGGAKQPSEVSNVFLMLNYSLKYDNLNNLEHFQKCT